MTSGPYESPPSRSGPEPSPADPPHTPHRSPQTSASTGSTTPDRNPATPSTGSTTPDLKHAETPNNTPDPRRPDTGSTAADLRYTETPNYAPESRRPEIDHDSVRAREKDAFGGIKFGSAFLGWLTTVGATVVLVAIGAAIAAAINSDNQLSTQDLRNVGIGTAIALLVILFVAYFAGGYVAGRMARFNGVRQGVAVWLWAVLIAIVLTIIGVVVGQQVDIASQVNLPPIPTEAGDLTAEGLIALGVLLVVTLIAAILGGLAGMRFHRRVDRAGFDTSNDLDPSDSDSRSR